MKESRIVTLRFGTARQRMALERWTSPTLSRRTCSPRSTEYHRVEGNRRARIGVAKQPRARSPTRNPHGRIRNLSHRECVLSHRCTCVRGATSRRVGVQVRAMVPRAAADAAAVEAMRAALHGKADTAQLAAVHDSVTASLHEVRGRTQSGPSGSKSRGSEGV
jgi:hypothetical protein